MISFDTSPIEAANTTVKPPIIAIRINTSEERDIIGNNLANKKTPAVTIVAEWISAETEVGPSMASGSHEWRGNWADLPIAPANIDNENIVATDPVISSADAALYKAKNSGKNCAKNWEKY